MLEDEVPQYDPNMFLPVPNRISNMILFQIKTSEGFIHDDMMHISAEVEEAVFLYKCLKKVPTSILQDIASILLSMPTINGPGQTFDMSCLPPWIGKGIREYKFHTKRSNNRGLELQMHHR